MLKQLSRRQAGQVSTSWPQWFLLSAGGILALSGANNLLDFFSRSQVWSLPEPLLGISFHYLLPLMGVVELFVAWLCLFTNKRTLAAMLVAWLVVNFVVYRTVLWTTGWYHPWVFVGGLASILNISPLLADIILAGVWAFLLLGSGLALWGNSQTAAALNLLNISCPACDGRIKFALQNIGDTISCPHCQTAITLRPPNENLKMTCVLCGGHVEFPAHALGQKISCPHCAKTITLLKPA